MENLIKMDDLGVPLFFGNIHMATFKAWSLVNFHQPFSLLSLPPFLFSSNLRGAPKGR